MFLLNCLCKKRRKINLRAYQMNRYNSNPSADKYVTFSLQVPEDAVLDNPEHVMQAFSFHVFEKRDQIRRRKEHIQEPTQNARAEVD